MTNFTTDVEGVVREIWENVGAHSDTPGPQLSQLSLFFALTPALDLSERNTSNNDLLDQSNQLALCAERHQKRHKRNSEERIWMLQLTSASPQN